MLDQRIYTFLTLYNEMNYRKTAERLNMSQPGVTQHIQYLENHYGVKLFDYNGRTLSKTSSADILKRHFDSMIAEESAIYSDIAPSDQIHLRIGATKTIGEFVILPEIHKFFSDSNHSLDLVIDNTEHLLQLLEQSEIDFAVIEGVFDKGKYGYHLYKKENFVGICAKSHPFAGQKVSLEEVLCESVVVREKGSGTRMLLQQAVEDKGFSLNSFRSCSSISNFSVICELVAREKAITFAYEPISRCRDDLSTFTVEDMHIKGEFNFVYCNEQLAKAKIALMFE